VVSLKADVKTAIAIPVSDTAELPATKGDGDAIVGPSSEGGVPTFTEAPKAEKIATAPRADAQTDAATPSAPEAPASEAKASIAETSETAGSGSAEAAPKAAKTASAEAARTSAVPDFPPKAPAMQVDPGVNSASPVAPAVGHGTGAAVFHQAASVPATSSTHQPLSAELVPVAGLAVEIAAQAQAGKNRFEIRLDPPELGRIDVRLDIDSEGQITSHVRVERAETLDMLRRDAPQLERALQQAGLKTSDSGLQFSLRDQSFSQQHQGREPQAPTRIVMPDETLAPIETQRHYARLAGIGSGVDIRV
jgi:flagellar hook-length control protein FliK